MFGGALRRSVSHWFATMSTHDGDEFAMNGQIAITLCFL